MSNTPRLTPLAPLGPAAAARLQLKPARRPGSPKNHAGEAAFVGVAIEGNVQTAYNGVYRHVSEHRGWPVLQNEDGRYLYRHEETGQWFLRKKHTPDEIRCASSIEAKDGPLPTGAQTWRCWVDGKAWSARTEADGKWEEHRCTVEILVRPQAARRRSPPKSPA